MLAASDSVEFSAFDFTVEPSDTVVVRGQPALLNCSAHHDRQSPVMQWVRDDVFINFDGETRRYCWLRHRRHTVSFLGFSCASFLFISSELDLSDAISVHLVKLPHARNSKRRWGFIPRLHTSHGTPDGSDAPLQNLLHWKRMVVGKNSEMQPSRCAVSLDAWFGLNTVQSFVWSAKAFQTSVRGYSSKMWPQLEPSLKISDSTEHGKLAKWKLCQCWVHPSGTVSQSCDTFPES